MAGMENKLARYLVWVYLLGHDQCSFCLLGHDQCSFCFWDMISVLSACWDMISVLSAYLYKQQQAGYTHYYTFTWGRSELSTICHVSLLIFL